MSDKKKLTKREFAKLLEDKALYTNTGKVRKYLSDNLHVIKDLIRCGYTIPDLLYGLNKHFKAVAEEYEYKLEGRKQAPISRKVLIQFLQSHEIPVPYKRRMGGPKHREKNEHQNEYEKIKHDLCILYENADWDGIKNYIAQLPDAHKKFCVEAIKKIKEQDKKNTKMMGG